MFGSHQDQTQYKKIKSDQVPKEILLQVLEAAMYAPSAGNEQPWQFVVLDQREMLDEAARINPNAAMAQKAPLAVMVCGDLSLEKHQGNWALECSASTQNLLLAAHALGLERSGPASWLKRIGWRLLKSFANCPIM